MSQPLVPLGTRKRKQDMAARRAVFCAFDGGFSHYAAALIHSVLTNSPGWHVHAYATNVTAEELASYPFARPEVSIHAEAREFPDSESQRCYMNSRRFIRYREHLCEVDLAVYLDADSLVLQSLDSIPIGSADVGLILRPYEAKPERQLRACTVVTRSTPAALAFWDAYEAALPEQTWFADQLALDKARCSGTAAIASIPENIYSAFSAGPRAVVLETCTEDKLGFRAAKDYARLFREITAEIEAKRAHVPGSSVALVWVVFGVDGQRLSAMRAAIRELSETVDPPGLTLLLEVSDTPNFLHDASGIPGLVYRHLVPSPRSAGVWQKEALWEVARQMLRFAPTIRYAVYLDVDCVPSAKDFFARVEALHDSGIKVAQPWQECRDTEYSDIGGTSALYRMAILHEPANRWGAQPGFCWSVSLAWLESIGGWANCEPLGGGDTLTVHRFVSGAAKWCPEATHMLEMANRHPVDRQPPACLEGVTLTHHSHGPRANRGYRLRYQVARECLGKDIMGYYELDPNGLLRVVSGATGDAWLRMLARRSEWSEDLGCARKIWEECQCP